MVRGVGEGGRWDKLGTSKSVRDGHLNKVIAAVPDLDGSLSLVCVCAWWITAQRRVAAGPTTTSRRGRRFLCTWQEHPSHKKRNFISFAVADKVADLCQSSSQNQ